jgi:hypothetical protein
MGALSKIVPVLFLFGCTTDTPTKTVIDDARVDIEQVAEDIKKLPAECKPDEFAQKLNLISGKLDAAEETHALEMRNCEIQLDKARTFNYGFFIGFVVLAWLWLKKKLLP